LEICLLDESTIRRFGRSGVLEGRTLGLDVDGASLGKLDGTEALGLLDITDGTSEGMALGRAIDGTTFQGTALGPYDGSVLGTSDGAELVVGSGDLVGLLLGSELG
jgi:hypothetical protein